VNTFLIVLKFSIDNFLLLEDLLLDLTSLTFQNFTKFSSHPDKRVYSASKYNKDLKGYSCGLSNLNINSILVKLSMQLYTDKLILPFYEASSTITMYLLLLMVIDSKISISSVILVFIKTGSLQLDLKNDN